MNNKLTFFTAKNVSYLAVLVALIIVFQACASVMKIGSTPISLVLVPIVFGGMLFGVGVGAALGAIFGVVVIICGVTGLDPFTFYLLGEHPLFTVILCLVKGTAAGALSAISFKLIKNKDGYLAALTASVVAPIVNSGLFILAALIMSDTVTAFMGAIDASLLQVSPIYLIMIVIVGVNFIVELALSIICSTGLYTVHRVVEKQIKKKSK